MAIFRKLKQRLASVRGTVSQTVRSQQDKRTSEDRLDVVEANRSAHEQLVNDQCLKATRDDLEALEARKNRIERLESGCKRLEEMIARKKELIARQEEISAAKDPYVAAADESDSLLHELADKLEIAEHLASNDGHTDVVIDEAVAIMRDGESEGYDSISIEDLEKALWDDLERIRGRVFELKAFIDSGRSIWNPADRHQLT
ncbi:uncharacterized protein AB675_2423 [Cyphellophora attinorum]|uniref:Uncharacterized protein n=1 Tax=Cyphellophora attinorum TaxID=1664694 RepID=A0A0N1HAR0_9EURO|nr:uncharacterized protein AB675_2423 [Phialophora attinorum]KPI45122.1 hypothetical protein AB675_2423 [Phialophora attinorum]